MTKQLPRRALLWLSFLLSLVVSPAPAEEITLHNGQKIVGTIVGFESDMFRVETEFGFALVRKDRVRTISFGTVTSKEAGQKPSEPKSPTPAPKPVPSIPQKAPAASSESPKPASPETVKPATASTPLPAAAVVPPPPAAAPAPAKAPPPPPVSRPLDQPLPAEIQERVEGNSYTNDTFHFTMYKPPGWRIHEDVPRETGRAIVAMGPEDEQTLLIVDREVWSGPPDLKRDTTETNLRSTYQDYRRLSESLIQLDGRPTVRRDFTGLMDGVEWHGVSIRVAEGNTIFGILGLTSAETFQFQQALLSKIINSFRFLPVKP
jgi:hypothetical protein